MKTVLVTIYALLDGNDVVRYIGKTTSMRHRYNGHRKNFQWLRSYQVLQVVNPEIWIEREMFWIAYGRLHGWPLLNKTKGGQGCHGIKFSPEHMEALRQSNIGRKRPASEETKALIRSKILGTKRSEACKEKHRIANRRRIENGYKQPFTEATRKKLSIRTVERNKARGYQGLYRTPEFIEKQRQSHLGKIPWNKGKSTSLAAISQHRASMIALGFWKQRKDEIMEVVTITVSASGEVQVAVSCVKGKKCKDVSEQIEKALGSKTKDAPTAEMREVEHAKASR